MYCVNAINLKKLDREPVCSVILQTQSLFSLISLIPISLPRYQCIAFKSSPKTKSTLSLLFITIVGLSNINFKATNKIEVSHCHTVIDKRNRTCHSKTELIHQVKYLLSLCSY